MNLFARLAVEAGGILSLLLKLTILLTTVLGSRFCTPSKSFSF